MGVDQSHVVTAAEAIRHPENLKGTHIVVVGGGETGCETAVFLAMDKGMDVTLLGRRNRLAPSAGPIAESALMKHLQQYVKKIYINTECVEIRERSLICRQGANTAELPADTVILASGMKEIPETAELFHNCAAEFLCIGDSNEVGNVRTAVRQGYDTALNV